MIELSYFKRSHVHDLGQTRTESHALAAVTAVNGRDSAVNFDAFVTAYTPEQLDDGETYEAERHDGDILVARHGYEGEIFPLAVILGAAMNGELTVEDVVGWSVPDVEASHVIALADHASFAARWAARERGIRVVSGVFEPSAGVWAYRSPRLNRYRIVTPTPRSNWHSIHERLEVEGEDAILHDANGEFVAAWHDLEGALPLDRPQAQVDEFEADEAAVASHRYDLPQHVLALPDGPEIEIEAVVFESYWVATRALEAQTREAAWATLISDLVFD